MVGLGVCPEAGARRVVVLVAVVERITQAGVPGFARGERDLKAEPSVGGNSLARSARHGHGNGAMKIPVRICRANLLPPLRPFGGDLATAHDAARLHLKHISEIASERNLKLKTYRLHAVVGDVKIFMQAAADRSADGEAERAG